MPLPFYSELISTLDEKQSHWKVPDNPFLGLCFRLLCWISVGDESLDATWHIVHAVAERPLDKGPLEKWEKYKEKRLNLLTVINILAGLLIATTALFLSTVPPTLTPPLPAPSVNVLLAYNTYGSYAIMTAAFGAALGAFIVASTQLYILTFCTAARYYHLLGKGRLRLCYMLVLMAYPSAAIGVSVILCAISLVLAGWDAGHLLYKIGTIVFLLVPTTSLFSFVLNVIWDHEGDKDDEDR
ncbi:hypothetical protein PILCRDRAFT_5228 [Piloderma croceum F 1598]|uniref:PGG domain-containing protein n=1 Tax=Piloderma croceum (strain F 1598) TaxID=765440 RepID=A0A0C3FMY5_PILCF|nr:hypothetical protein PILCRDRAFT_5228 [Piloderma croceum F 1598]